ncbi:hypothetical protein [Variovorax paradoxus]|uniref:hypothetical protein n=1 Tax=Variovorax paradoxus TaxID=34073 RepID=UPI0029C79B20|nr:hypothetical protein RZE77_30560 [Variovorax paradoxus]
MFEAQLVNIKMTNRSSVKLKNSFATALSVIVEPWANEFHLPPGSECEVVSIGGAVDTEILIELEAPSTLIFWVNTPGALYEYWQDGKLVD